MTVSRALLLTPKVCSKVTIRNSSGMKGGSWNFDNYKNTLLSNMKPAESVKIQYKKIFLFVSIPILALTSYIAWKDHEKHHQQERKEYVPYDYLNIRKKAFPFGDGNHTLFHNPHEQYVPGVGYEKERHH